MELDLLLLTGYDVRVLIDDRVCAEVERLHGTYFLRPGEDYVRIRFPTYTDFLHRFAFTFVNGPLQAGEEVHHKNHQTLDNRLSNLKRISAKAHKIEHKRARARRFTRHTEGDNNLYISRKPSPATHVTLPNAIPPNPSGPVSAIYNKTKEVLDLLAGQYDQLAAQIPNLQFEEQQLGAEWHARESRRLGLAVPKLKLSTGELAFVLLVISKRFEMDEVIDYLGCDALVATKLRSQTNISSALESWSKTKRIPMVNPPSTTRRKMSLRGEAWIIQTRFTALEERFEKLFAIELAPLLESDAALPASLDAASKMAAESLRAAAARRHLSVTNLLERTWTALGDRCGELVRIALLTRISAR